MGDDDVCIVVERVMHARVVGGLMVDNFNTFFIYDDDFSGVVVRVWIEPCNGKSSVQG